MILFSKNEDYYICKSTLYQHFITASMHILPKSCKFYNYYLTFYIKGNNFYNETSEKKPSSNS